MIEVIERRETEFGTIEIIYDPQYGTFTYSQGSCYHSQAAANGESTCAYVHLMHGLIRQQVGVNPDAQILVIGCAGGSLATMLYRAGYAVTIVDINPHAFELARSYFHLPQGVECVVADGVEYLARTQTEYHAIALDVFNQHGKIPNAFLEESLCSSLRRLLPQDGLVLANSLLVHDMDGTADYLAFAYAQSGFDSIIFECTGQVEHNAIIAASMSVAPPLPQGIALAPEWMQSRMEGIIRREANPALRHRVVL
jgi:spermidine synthase